MLKAMLFRAAVFLLATCALSPRVGAIVGDEWEIVNAFTQVTSSTTYQVFVPAGRQFDRPYHETIAASLCEFPGDPHGCRITFWNDRSQVPAGFVHAHEMPPAQANAQSAEYATQFIWERGWRSRLRFACWFYRTRQKGEADHCLELLAARNPPTAGSCDVDPEADFENRCVPWDREIAALKRENCAPGTPWGKQFDSCETSHKAQPSAGNWLRAVLVCEKLGEKRPLDCGAVSERRRSQLWYEAVLRAQPEEIDWLAAHGSKPGEGLWATLAGCTKPNAQGRARGDIRRCAQVLDRLIAAGAKLNVTFGGTDNHTPLSSMAYFNDVDMTRLMLDRGADPNLGGNTCRSALDLAANTDAARVMEGHGARRRNIFTRTLCGIAGGLVH